MKLYESFRKNLKEADKHVYIIYDDKNIVKGSNNPAFKDKYKVIINGKEVKPGDKIKDFRGDEHVFKGVTNPGTPFGGMNGKIRVIQGDGEMEYYPSVFNAKLEKINESAPETGTDYTIRYWIDEEARDEGFSETYSIKADTLEEAIAKTKDFFYNQECASCELEASDDEGTVYFGCYPDEMVNFSAGETVKGEEETNESANIRHSKEYLNSQKEFICDDCGLEFDRDEITAEDEDGNDLCPACASSNIISNLDESEDEMVRLWVNGRFFWEGKRSEVDENLILDVAQQASDEFGRNFDADEVDIKSVESDEDLEETESEGVEESHCSNDLENKLNLKVGDEVEFYSTGYKENGKFSSKPNILIKTKVKEVYDNGDVACKDPQGIKDFDYISQDEIISVNGKKLKESVSPTKYTLGKCIDEIKAIDNIKGFYSKVREIVGYNDVEWNNNFGWEDNEIKELQRVADARYEELSSRNIKEDKGLTEANEDNSERPWLKDEKTYKDFKKFVDVQLRDGAIDDPEYVKTLSPKEYEDLLVDTWMKDKDMLDMYEERYINLDRERDSGDADIMDKDELKESVGELNVNKIAKFLEDSVNTLQTTDYTCCRYILDGELAIFVGWSDGYDESDDTVIHAKDYPTAAINAGIKGRADALWTDYDYLNFPWSEETGEVWDSGLSIGPNEDYKSDAKYFIEEYSEIRKALDAGEYTLGD
jgi:hypothetical protein